MYFKEHETKVAILLLNSKEYAKKVAKTLLNLSEFSADNLSD